MSKVTSLTALVFLFISSVANSAVPVTENEAVLFYGYDVLGSPITTSDEQGRVLWYENSRPYGQSLKRVNVQGEGFGDNFDEGAVSRLGYTGHQSDSDTGLVYMRARYYDPQVGRFYGNDPVGFTEDSSGTFNRYSYVENNPYRSTDPTGESLLEIFTELAPAAGRSIGGLVAFGVGHATGDSALVDAAVEGMASEQGANLFAILAVIAPPGAGKLRNVGAKLNDGPVGAAKVSPSTLHERGTKIPGGRKIEDTLAGSNKIKNSQGETFKRIDFAPSKPHAGLSPHTHPNFRNSLPDGSVRSGVSGHGQSITRKDIIDSARDGGQRTGGL